MRIVKYRPLLAALVTLCVGCFAARLPPHLELAPSGAPARLSVGVVIPSENPDFPDIDLSTAETLAADLANTGLFESVRVLSPNSAPPDVTVSLSEWKRPDPASWCYESYAYTVFTAFIIPGCARALGYRLLISPRGGEPQNFDFTCDELHVSGWIALGLLPCSSWQLPAKDRSRISEYLRAQLAALVPKLVALSTISGR